MLTRSKMLTIKKRSFALLVLAVISAAALTACGPAGPRDLRKGERLIQSGEFAEAVPVLEEGVRLLRNSPGNVQAAALNLLGLAQHGAGHLDAAGRAYLEALKLDRNLWAADFNLGCLRLEQSNYLGAIDNLTTYATSYPKDINGLLLLGRAHLKLAMERSGIDRYPTLEYAKRDYESAEKIRSTAEACNALGLIALMQRRVRGTDPVAPGATTEFVLRPTRPTGAPPNGQWWVVQAYTTSPNALSTSPLQRWTLGKVAS